MLKIKKILKEKAMIIVIGLILLICSVAIAIGVYAQITNQNIKEKKQEEQNINYDELKSNFQNIFNNKVNIISTTNSDINYEEMLTTKFNIQEKEDGKYTIDAKIPSFNGNSKTLDTINKEILNVFGREIIKVRKESIISTTYNLDYVAYVNNDIISLVLMCKYKDGKNAQRIIIQCYNYDTKNDKLLNIDDIINYKGLNKEEMQNRINEEIAKVNSQMQVINEQGYNVYFRDSNSKIYELNNTPNFFLGENNYFYIVYSYGNNNYTSEMDLIIF